jgi:sulfite reductase (NADPH) hemoprotein beta-component
VEAAKAVLTIHRDFGDRTNRKHARLKYVLEERGQKWFRDELNERLGFELQSTRPFHFTRQGDLFGWHRQSDGNYFLGLYVENGRIQDTGSYQFKTALREVAGRFRPEIRLTPSQNLLLTGVNTADREEITKLLARHGVPVDNQATVIRRTAMACPALPTCGRALAEAERMSPDLLGRIEQLLAELGLQDEEIVIRITGCPNGCARSLLAELGLVGKAPNKYQIYLGGNAASTRLNELFKESVRTEDIVNELRPLFSRFAQERLAGERFGDFCRRVILK